MFGNVMASNSTMVGEMFECLCLQSLKMLCKKHGIYMFGNVMASNSTMVGEIFECLCLKSLKML